MMMARLTTAFLTAAFAMAAPICGFAEETGWLTGDKALATFRKLEIQGLMPTRVQCRDSNKRGLDFWETEYDVTMAKRPAGLQYYWAVGNFYGNTKVKAEKLGYRQVSLSQYKRKKSGLVVRCAIWHK
jgi:hypothetical protein